MHFHVAKRGKTKEWQGFNLEGVNFAVAYRDMHSFSTAMSTKKRPGHSSIYTRHVSCADSRRPSSSQSGVSPLSGTLAIDDRDLGHLNTSF